MDRESEIQTKEKKETKVKKKIFIIAIAAMLVCALTVPVTAMAVGKNGQAGESNVAFLSLYEKDPSDNWSIVDGGAWGKMKYNLAGPTFDFVFNGHGLEASTDYSLIYYADPWPGDNPGYLIASGTTNRGGNINLVGSVDPGMNFPNFPDANYLKGAKIWLVLSADYDADNTEMDGWNPTEYLFEYDLITYTDE